MFIFCLCFYFFILRQKELFGKKYTKNHTRAKTTSRRCLHILPNKIYVYLAKLPRYLSQTPQLFFGKYAILKS